MSLYDAKVKRMLIFSRIPKCDWIIPWLTRPILTWKLLRAKRRLESLRRMMRDFN